jgi:hypothetical protein
MLVLCAGALAQARARAQGSCAPPPARGQQPHLRRTAGPDAAHAHRRFRAAGPRASFVTPVCKNLQGCRGHWLARAARAQGCRARALACARARAQGGTHVGGTRASARARAHPPTSCHQHVGLTVWFKFKRQSFFCVHGVELLGTHGVELLLHLAEHGLMKLVPIYMF